MIYGKIREKILLYGTEAIPRLEHAWDNSFEGIIQDRILEIIHRIQMENLFVELGRWRMLESHDLLRGYFLISRYQYPDLREKDIRDQIDQIRKDIWLELNSNLTALEKVQVINHILFDIHQFSGNKTNFEAPSNFFLNEVLQTRKGNTLSLGILYILLARSLDMPVFGVDLPQYFILAYADLEYEGALEMVRDDEVLFYINPFNRGAVFTRREIELFIRQMKITEQKSFFIPCDHLTIIRRAMEQLIHAFEKSGNPQKAEELRKLNQALD
ncbi:MAG: transglutaminase family protein [Bacteroidales bacterium]|nr:transglutaminase family protein [Bacteroidales bacterium]